MTGSEFSDSEALLDEGDAPAPSASSRAATVPHRTHEGSPPPRAAAGDAAAQGRGHVSQSPVLPRRPHKPAPVGPRQHVSQSPMQPRQPRPRDATTAVPAARRQKTSSGNGSLESCATWFAT